MLASDVGVSTTGVAGPDAQDGQPVGTVHIAVSMAGSTRVSSLLLHGDRPAIRRATVVAALDLVSRVLDDTAER